MGKFTEFNKANLSVLREKLNAVLAESGIEGVNFKLGNFSYDSDNVTIKLTAHIEGGQSREEKMLLQMAEIMDLDTDKVTALKGMDVQLCGYNSRARTLPFIIRDVESTGKYKISSDDAKRLFAKAS